MLHIKRTQRINTNVRLQEIMHDDISRNSYKELIPHVRRWAKAIKEDADYKRYQSMPSWLKGAASHVCWAGFDKYLFINESVDSSYVDDPDLWLRSAFAHHKGAQLGISGNLILSLNSAELAQATHKMVEKLLGKEYRVVSYYGFWAPTAENYRMLYELSGYHKARYLDRLYLIFKVLRALKYQYVFTNGLHVGEAFGDALLFLKKTLNQGKILITNEQFEYLLKGWVAIRDAQYKEQSYNLFLKRTLVQNIGRIKNGNVRRVVARIAVRKAAETPEINKVRDINLWEKGEVPTSENDIHNNPLWSSWMPRKFESLFTWKEVHGRVPKIEGLKVLPPDMIRELKPSLKYLIRMIKSLGDIEIQEHSLIAMANIAIVFRGNYKRWLDLTKESYSHMSLEGRYHASGINLPSTWDKDVEVILIRTAQTGDIYKTNRIITAMGNWSLLKAETGLSSKSSVESILKAVKVYRYPAIKSIEFARVAVECGVHVSEYKGIEDYFLRSVSNVTQESIPYVSVTSGEYRMYRLRKDDPRGLFLGEYTNCCQHPGGAGSSCAWHGVQDPNGAFFVIEQRGRIIAQSWAWRNGDIVVMDNIESVSVGTYIDKIKYLYTEAANAMIGRLGVTQVNVGGGYGIGLQRLRESEWARTDVVNPPVGVYTDAGSNQFRIDSHE